jgi:hypothetical protein
MFYCIKCEVVYATESETDEVFTTGFHRSDDGKNVPLGVRARCQSSALNHDDKPV